MLNHRLVTSTVMAALGLGVAITLGCNGMSPSGPSAALSVIAISPNAGSTAGATPVGITGTGFHSGAMVTIDGTRVTTTVHSETFLSVSMPAHAAGAVEVVVTNGQGASFKVPGGYTYVLIIPVVTQVFPNVGASGGGTNVTITGAGFQAGATVTIDGVTPNALFVSSGTAIFFFTKAHAAGTADIVVTNPNGQTVRLTQGFTYVPAGSFDFNGDWQGWVGDFESPNVIQFSIRNNVVVSVLCRSLALTFSPQPAVINGEFSSVGGGITGTTVSANQATGTINTGPCLGSDWAAVRR